jgi:cell division protein FtsN
MMMMTMMMMTMMMMMITMMMMMILMMMMKINFSIFEVRFKQMCKTTQNGNKPIPEANSESNGKYINTRTPPVQKAIRFIAVRREKSAKPNVKCEP